MPVDPATGIWHPRLSPRQLDVYNCRKRYILGTGPRICGKSRGSLHRVIRHAWETNPCRFAIFTKFKGTALSGIWPLLTKVIMKEWLEDGQLASDHGEFRYIRTPRELGAIRMQYFTIENYWGGESEIQLHSLDFDKDVEDKVLSTEYSGFYFSELQHFNDIGVFTTTVQQLRMPDVKFEDHLWISDTNPPENSIDHFAYQIWFKDRDSEPAEDASEEERAFWRLYQENLALFEYTLDDAIFADRKMIAQLKANYRNDPEGWNRFVLGKWTKTRGHEDKHFSKIFKKHVHVAGDLSARDESEWTYLNPDDTTHELHSGWDIGKVNHAWVAGQKRLTDDGKTRWEILDEHVVIAEKVKIPDFTREVIEKRKALEKIAGHPIDWTDWTDTSAFDWSKGGTDEIDADIVEAVSDGEIVFQGAGAAKRPGSIRKRVERLRELLNENRILVSAHCKEVIEMFEELRKGKKDGDFVARGQKWKHVFDALTYMIYSETLEDLEEDISKQAAVGCRLVSVALNRS